MKSSRNSESASICSVTATSSAATIPAASGSFIPINLRSLLRGSEKHIMQKISQCAGIFLLATIALGCGSSLDANDQVSVRADLKTLAAACAAYDSGTVIQASDALGAESDLRIIFSNHPNASYTTSSGTETKLSQTVDLIPELHRCYSGSGKVRLAR